MSLFGKKKEEIKPIEMLPILSELEKDIQPTKPPIEKLEKTEKKIEKEPERPMFAPLFVKIDRYRQILNSVGYLKNTMMMMRTSLATLNELDRARNETMGVIEETLEKIEKKMNELDNELVRPAGYHEMEKFEYQDLETVDATISDLKGQIEQLKTEVQSMS